ncbi:uncharacterized protein LOC112050694 [Bicyclus anynana]|uniref:Uncharacterized protein LOC112050694 n=1 Tax=Bicyclus anynana TaxID=110368 RepID=A0A6J1NIM1_BICAN|nr:uncharacterized protein LOC112050694 [Bicyclus anynana]
MMLRSFIIGLLILAVKSFPINEEINQNIEANTPIENDLNTKNVEEIKKALDDVTYVQNFKNMMADYVKSQYNNLTHHEMDSIKEYLEEFCIKFASDLKDIIENGVTFERDTINDGLPDSTFENVRDCIKTELPGMDENTADRITYVLRKNLFLTRQKIDRIINDSKFSAIENS